MDAQLRLSVDTQITRGLTRAVWPVAVHGIRPPPRSAATACFNTQQDEDDVITVLVLYVHAVHASRHPSIVLSRRSSATRTVVGGDLARQTHGQLISTCVA